MTWRHTPNHMDGEYKSEARLTRRAVYEEETMGLKSLDATTIADFVFRNYEIEPEQTNLVYVYLASDRSHLANRRRMVKSLMQTTPKQLGEQIMLAEIDVEVQMAIKHAERVISRRNYYDYIAIIQRRLQRAKLAILRRN